MELFAGPQLHVTDDVRVARQTGVYFDSVDFLLGRNDQIDAENALVAVASQLGTDHRSNFLSLVVHDVGVFNRQLLPPHQRLAPSSV